MSTRISVDRVRCDGRGACAELFPEVISLDDWGYPIIAPGDIPNHLLSVAREAVSGCPVMAMRMTRGSRAAMDTLTAVSQTQVTEL